MVAALASIVVDVNDDWLVRQIAARDLELYPNTTHLDAVLSVALDPEDDLDVRVNLIEGFRRWNPSLLPIIAAQLRRNDALAKYV